MKTPPKGNSLVVQWLGLHASTAGSKGSILGRGPNISHAVQSKQTKNPPNETRSTITIVVKEGNPVRFPSGCLGTMTRSSVELSKEAKGNQL